MNYHQDKPPIKNELFDIENNWKEIQIQELIKQIESLNKRKAQIADIEKKIKVINKLRRKRESRNQKKKFINQKTKR